MHTCSTFFRVGIAGADACNEKRFFWKFQIFKFSKFTALPKFRTRITCSINVVKFEEVLIKSVRTNDDIDRNPQVLLFKKRNIISKVMHKFCRRFFPMQKFCMRFLLSTVKHSVTLTRKMIESKRLGRFVQTPCYNRGSLLESFVPVSVSDASESSFLPIPSH